MARFRRIDVVLKMEETGMIPIFYNQDIDLSKEAVREGDATAGSIKNNISPWRINWDFGQPTLL